MSYPYGSYAQNPYTAAQNAYTMAAYRGAYGQTPAYNSYYQGGQGAAMAQPYAAAAYAQPQQQYYSSYAAASPIPAVSTDALASTGLDSQTSTASDAPSDSGSLFSLKNLAIGTGLIGAGGLIGYCLRGSGEEKKDNANESPAATPAATPAASPPAQPETQNGEGAPGKTEGENPAKSDLQQAEAPKGKLATTAANLVSPALAFAGPLAASYFTSPWIRIPLQGVSALQPFLVDLNKGKGWKKAGVTAATSGLLSAGLPSLSGVWTRLLGTKVAAEGAGAGLKLAAQGLPCMSSAKLGQSMSQAFNYAMSRCRGI